MLTAKLTKNQLTALICLALALVTTALYWPMTHHNFVNFDDDDYITNNPHVKAGLTRAGVIWAFQTGAAANWHPLTWLSHMLDCQLYGLYPGGHHSTNLLFHVANTLLLFLWLRQLTGALWRSAFVAALFAWHPLHVESVAWAAERKDVLSAFFWMLTLMAYTRYARGVTSGTCQVTRTDLASSPVTRLPAEALGRVAQIILEPAERGCPSRSTFDNPKTRGISCAHLAILPAAGGTPALRSIWATRPLAKVESGFR
jgi:hypothetical protein